MYREGCELIGSDGKKIRETDRRAIRAVEKKSSYGSLLAHTSWLMHEFTTMKQLRQSGVTVPEPIASGENAILMTYYGDGNLPAPTLIEVKPADDEAQRLYQHILADIEQMLRQGVVHGDLSAYNILYWDHQPIIIDLPQVVDPQSNSNAYAIFKRDVTRICEYFQKAGVNADPVPLADSLWSRYYSIDPQDRAADESRLMVDDDD
jgi:RIO kinase 1